MSDIGLSLADATLALQSSKRAPKNLSDGALKNADDKKLRETAESFEAYFLQTVLEDLKLGESLVENKSFGAGAGGGVWNSMLNEEYAKTLSKGGGFGIADAVYAELAKRRDGQKAAAEALQKSQAQAMSAENDARVAQSRARAYENATTLYSR